MKRKIICLILSLLLLTNTSISVFASSNDVSVLMNLGILSGYEDGELRLENQINRAEFTKLIVEASKYRSLVSSSIQVSIFKDVKYTYWGAPYIYVALENSLISGYEDATFKPDNTIVFEECLAIIVRLLGYTNDDFAISWPYGPINIAQNLGLLNGVNCVAGQEMTRGDVATLIKNMLIAKNKSNNDYVADLNYSLKENVEIISIDAAGNILTDNGTFESKYVLSKNYVGQKGTLLLDQYGDALGFVAVTPSSSTEQEGNYVVKKYVVSSILDDTIVTYLDNVRYELNINNDVVTYKDGTKTTYATIKDSLNLGDVLSIRYNNGIIQYIVVNETTSNTIAQADLTKYVYYSALNDSVLVYKGNTMQQLTINDDVVVYKGNNKYTYGDIKSELVIGDVFNVKYTNNIISYISVEKGEYIGPVTAASGGWQNKFSVDVSTASIIRNGVKCSSSDVQVNDILYYSNDLNMVFAYNKQYTGVYQNATPNKDTPSSITVSGKNYDIESSTAFNKLSSNGSVNYGDTITLLLGKDGKVADVITPSAKTQNLVYFVKEAGAKEFKVDNTSTKSYYACLVAPDGTETDYITNTSCKSYVNAIVKVSFENEKAKLSRITDKYTISGKLDWDNKTIGTYDLSTDVKILDVYSTSSSDATLYKSIYPQRIDGVTLSSNSVAYYELDEKNKVSKLILNNVTGDMIKYGIVTKVKNESDEYFMSGEYEYDIAGTVYTYSTSDRMFTSVSRGTPAKFIIQDEELKSMQSLTLLKGSVSEINNTHLKSGQTSYAISDEVVVYLRNYSGTYLILGLDELIAERELYSIQAYYDKSQKSGGRIRIIVAAKK